MKKIIAIFLLFTFAFVLRLWNFNQVGRMWDEYWYVESGYTFMQLFQKKDFDNPFWYETPDHPPLAKYIYGFAAQFDDIKTVDGVTQFPYDYTYPKLVSILAVS